MDNPTLRRQTQSSPDELLKGKIVGDKTFKVLLDRHHLTEALSGKTASPRHEAFYFNDDGSLVCLLYNQWRIVFAEQGAHGFDVWDEPFVTLRRSAVLHHAFTAHGHTQST